MLFRGQPSLIQGFNTFLPPGYRIECSMDQNDGNMITVTTPNGTTTQTLGGMVPRVVSRIPPGDVPSPGAPGMAMNGAGAIAGTGGAPVPPSSAATAASGAPLALHDMPASRGPGAGGPSPYGGVSDYAERMGPAPPPGVKGLPRPPPTGPAAPVAPVAPGMPMRGGTSPGSMGMPPSMPPPQPGPPPQQQQHGAYGGAVPMGYEPVGRGPPAGAPEPVLRPPVEFNHAISYVNKIKQRFSNDPDTYKQFLEILQTYQKEQRPIHEVYAQVTVLFDHAKDLLEEFKQFLPDTGAATGGAGLFGMIGHMTNGMGPGEAPPPHGAPGSAAGVNAAAGGVSSAGGGMGPAAAVGPGSAPNAGMAYDAVPARHPLHHQHHSYPGTQAVSAPSLSRKKRVIDDMPPGPESMGLASTTSTSTSSSSSSSAPKTGGSTSRKRSKKGEGAASASGGPGAPPPGGAPGTAGTGLPQAGAPYLQAVPRPGPGEMMGDAMYARGAPLPPGYEALPPEGYLPAAGMHGTQAYPPPHMAAGGDLVPMPPPPPIATVDEVTFFERVKKHLDDRATYMDFLKLLNLYAQDMIDVPTLVDRVALFLNGRPELLGAFKTLVGYDMGRHGWLENEDPVLENVPALERERFDLSTQKSCGPSYRKLPADEVKLSCSGRDALCWEVLNDGWVSHPTWASEGESFNPHKKNVYEDALYRSEEERHEYDYHIEANLRTIALLEPIAARIAVMDADERASFRLKPGLGGQSKSIYQRIIKKVYGRQHGLEVIAALHDNPCVAVPIVLARLKQKDEEWKRAQREWNKMWREVDARNFYKALDHQGVNFKSTDKKTITTKALVNEIESLVATQQQRRLTLDPSLPRLAPRYQLSFAMNDPHVLADVLRLVAHYLDRPSTPFQPHDRARVRQVIKAMLSRMLGTEPASLLALMTSKRPRSRREGDDDDHGAGDTDDDGDADNDVLGDDDADANGDGDGDGDGDGNGNGDADGDGSGDGVGVGDGNGDGDSHGDADAHSESESHRAADTEANNDTENTSTSSTNHEGEASKTPVVDTWLVHTPSTAAREMRVSTQLFGNTTMYVFMRLLCLLYTRLASLKHVHIQDQRSISSSKVNPLAANLGLMDTATGPAGLVSTIASRLPGARPLPQDADTLSDADRAVLTLHPSQYYAVLLELVVRHLRNELDQSSFEEAVRYMYTREGYVVYTIDKVIQALIKTALTISTDAKCQELLDNFASTHRDCAALWADAGIDARDVKLYRRIIASRMAAEHTIGRDEHLFRIEAVPRPPPQVADMSPMTPCELHIQLMSHDDHTLDDPHDQEQRWLQYIASYCLWSPTEGLPTKICAPFLHRNLPASPDSRAAADADDSTRYIVKNNLDIRVCMRTYRLFFVQDTEDVFARIRVADRTAAPPSTDVDMSGRQQEEEEARAKVNAQRTQRWHAWLHARLEAMDETKSTLSTATDAAAEPLATEAGRMPPTEPPASASSPSAGAYAPVPAPDPNEHAEETGDVPMVDASPSLPGEELGERDRHRSFAMEHHRDVSGPSHTVSTRADATYEAPSEASHAHVSSETPVQRSSSSETAGPTSVDAKMSTATTTTTTPTASEPATEPSTEPAVAATSAPAKDTRMQDKAEPAAASSHIATDRDSNTQESRPAAPGPEAAPSS